MPWLAIGALLMAVGVGAGAFGAHALRDVLSPERMVTWRTAVDYHLVHGLALVLLGALEHRGTSTGWAPWLLLAGLVVFSGSLYVLCLSGIRWFGAITPIGGVSLIAGWLVLAFRFLRA